MDSTLNRFISSATIARTPHMTFFSPLDVSQSATWVPQNPSFDGAAPSSATGIFPLPPSFGGAPSRLPSEPLYPHPRLPSSRAPLSCAIGGAPRIPVTRAWVPAVSICDVGPSCDLHHSLPVSDGRFQTRLPTPSPLHSLLCDSSEDSFAVFQRFLLQSLQSQDSLELLSNDTPTGNPTIALLDHFSPTGFSNIAFGVSVDSSFLDSKLHNIFSDNPRLVSDCSYAIPPSISASHIDPDGNSTVVTNVNSSPTVVPFDVIHAYLLSNKAVTSTVEADWDGKIVPDLLSSPVAVSPESFDTESAGGSAAPPLGFQAPSSDSLFSATEMAAALPEIGAFLPSITYAPAPGTKAGSYLGSY